MKEENEYFLGTHRAELERLAFQSRAWQAQTHRLWDRMGIEPGSKVLDLGCGPGFCTLELAERVGPDGELAAVDLSERFLEVLRARLEKHRIRNVRTLLLDVAREPLPDGGFDYVFARWLHQYVDNLDDVVGRTVGCLKPGGKVGYLEVYNYRGVSFAPESEVFNLVTDRLMQFYADNGRNVNAGGHLPAALARSGARIESVENASPVARRADIHWEWYRQFSFSMLPRLVEAGLIDAGVRAAYEAAWGAYSGIEGAFLSVPSHVAIVASIP